MQGINLEGMRPDEGFLHGIEWRGADIAKDDTDGPDHEDGQTFFLRGWAGRSAA